MAYDNPLYHQLIARLRQWCLHHHLHEVRTPVLSPHPPYEPNIKSLTCGGQHLHASPECAMKKLLAQEARDIYQIAPVFRDDIASPLHLKEFTLLEWYRCGKNAQQMMAECAALLHDVFDHFATRQLHRPPYSLSDLKTVRHLSMTEAFHHYAHLDLLAAIDHPLTPSCEPLRAEAHKRNVATHEADGWEDIFHRLFLEFIEPHLGVDEITFLTDYPTPLALLARPHDDEPRLCHRFELFILRIELANGYEELRGQKAHAERFALWGKPYDGAFVQAMEHLPCVTGMALGIERLFLLLSGEASLAHHWA